MSPEMRASLRERFERWLDRISAAESAPEGLDAELVASLEGEPSVAPIDQHALWSALTALAQEVRLQGRAFQAVELQLRSAQTPAAAPPSKAPVDGVLLDIRDALDRGLTDCAAQRAKVGWWGRAGRLDSAIAALRTGYELGLARVDEALKRAGLRPHGAPGQPFDPATMRAVAVEQRADLPEGTVIAVMRIGYLDNRGESVRLAEVTVSRDLSPRGQS